MQRSLERSQHAALLTLCLHEIANASPSGIRGERAKLPTHKTLP